MEQREVKFKVWDDEMKRMSHVYPIGSAQVWFDNDVLPADFVRGKVLRFKFLQYTGPKDPAGKEVYEGDKPGGPYDEMFVDWCDEHGGWTLRPIGVKDYCHQCSGDFFWQDFADDLKEGKTEVIGHIYE